MDAKKPCEEPCPKCGGGDINRRHRRKGERWDARNKESEPFSKHINTHGLWVREAVREIITHHCRECQFDWQTPTLKKAKNGR